MSCTDASLGPLIDTIAARRIANATSYFTPNEGKYKRVEEKVRLQVPMFS
jgi:hypothetical protein